MSSVVVRRWYSLKLENFCYRSRLGWEQKWKAINQKLNSIGEKYFSNKTTSLRLFFQTFPSSPLACDPHKSRQQTWKESHVSPLSLLNIVEMELLPFGCCVCSSPTIFFISLPPKVDPVTIFARSRRGSKLAEKSEDTILTISEMWVES